MDSKSYFVLNIMEYLGTPAEKDLLSLAMEQISLIQYKVGGILCVLECEQKKGLLDFYCEQNHFVEFGKRNTKSTNKSLLQLLKTI